MKQMISPKLLALPLLACVAACTVGPNYKGPPSVASDALTRKAFVRADDTTTSAAPGLANWWEGLADPVLNGLVQDALTHNPDIDIAQARIRAATAQMQQHQAERLPSASANATYLHARLPGVDLGGSSSDSGSGSGSESESSVSSLNFYNVGANASWEVDLFGGTRRAIEQSRATADARFADLADAQVSLSAQVAQAYVNLRDTQERVRLNARSIELQKQALGLTQQRFNAGTASSLDVERLQSQLDTTEAQDLPLHADIAAYLNQLATLIGREPGALDAQLSDAAAIPLPPASVAVGDPAGLIAHRPDIRAAERTLAASTAGVGVSEAKRFPRLSFMGLLGLGGTNIGDVVDPDMFTALIAPSISWSFLDFGRTAAAVHQSEAQRDEADARYRKAVLAALQDAETSLARFGNARKQLVTLFRAEASAERSATLNGQRVKAGTSSTIDQIAVERQRLSAATSVSQGKAALTNSYIAVQKSLGLGWTEPSKP
jgi:NodT family efflux transporter outer membrane factor (OMF) lipoprotein